MAGSRVGATLRAAQNFGEVDGNVASGIVRARCSRSLHVEETEGMGRKAWILGLLVIIGLGTWSVVRVLEAERASAAAAGHPVSGIVSREDFSVIVTPAREMLHGQRSNGYPDDYRYPPPTAAQYALITAIPDDFLYILVRIIGGILLAGALLAWCGRDGLRRHWYWPLLLSLPVLNAMRIGQFNAMVGFAAMTGAVFAFRSRRMGWAGLALGIAFVGRPTNTTALAAAMLVLAARTDGRTLLRFAGPAAAWTLLMSVIAWHWDDRWWVHLGIAASGGQVGVPRMVSEQFGIDGVYAGIALLVIGSGLAALRLDRRLSLDAAAILIGISLLLTQLGGEYVGIFAFPIVAVAVRRTGHAGLAWAISLLYYALGVVDSLIPGRGTDPIYIMTPILIVVAAGVALAFAHRDAGGDAPTEDDPAAPPPRLRRESLRAKP